MLAEELEYQQELDTAESGDEDEFEDEDEEGDDEYGENEGGEDGEGVSCCLLI